MQVAWLWLIEYAVTIPPMVSLVEYCLKGIRRRSIACSYYRWIWPAHCWVLKYRSRYCLRLASQIHWVSIVSTIKPPPLPLAPLAALLSIKSGSRLRVYQQHFRSHDHLMIPWVSCRSGQRFRSRESCWVLNIGRVSNSSFSVKCTRSTLVPRLQQFVEYQVDLINASTRTYRKIRWVSNIDRMSNFLSIEWILSPIVIHGVL